MDFVRKEPKDIWEPGPIGSVRGALNLYVANVLIQLALMLPPVILHLVAGYFFFMQYLPLKLHEVFNPGSPSPGAPPFPGAVSAFGGGLELDLKKQAEVLVSIATVSLVFQAAVDLSLSTTLYTVGLHYGGQPFSFVDAVRSATPRSWMRLALTTFGVNVSTYTTMLVLSLPENQDSVRWRWVWAGGVMILSCSASCGLSILLVISTRVSVLGEGYGWAPLKKSRKQLPAGTRNVAILLSVLWTVPALMLIGLGAAILFQLRKGDFYVDCSRSDLALLSFTVVFFLAWTTFLWELRSLCAGVLYVSCKAYHDQSLSDSLYEKLGILVEGYERLETRGALVKENALLKGALVTTYSKSENFYKKFKIFLYKGGLMIFQH